LSYDACVRSYAILAVVVSALTCALSAGACAGPRGFTSADRAGVEAVLEQQRAAWNRGDLLAYMDGYRRTPRLLFTSGGQVQRGWDDTYARYRERYGASRAQMGKLDFDIVDLQPVGSDGAIVFGRWKLSGPRTAGGVFTVVFERTREGWRIVHDHTWADPSAQ
jgi:beta-aspartyl-peptidase (threonine type)